MAGFTRPEVVPRLDSNQKDWLMAHLLLDRELFDKAVGILKPFHFPLGSDANYRLIWETVLNIETKHPGIIGFDNEKAWNIIEVEAQAKMNNLPAVYSPSLGEGIFSRDEHDYGLLCWIYSKMKPGEIIHSYGKDLLQRYLREQAQAHLRNAFHSAGDDVISNITSILDQTQRAEEAAGFDDMNIESGAPEGWEPAPLQKYSTNVTFLDKFLNGGHAKGETYGVLGVYGVGKSTLAMQIFSQGAEYQLSLQAENQVEYPGDCYFFYYEGTENDMKIRLWSQVAVIDRNILEEYGKEPLSTMGNLREYEHKRYANLITKNGLENTPGEFERLEEAKQKIRINMWLSDMTGAPKSPHKGTGYIDEIARDIIKHQKYLEKKDGRPHYVSVVVIDYAGICVSRHINANGLEENRRRHLVGEFGDTCRRLIAVPFNTPVWIFHQLSGDSNKRTHATKQHHSDAAESKAFAENLWFCFNIGTQDDRYNIMQMTCSKARRTERLGTPPLLRIDGPFTKMIEAEGFYMADHGNISMTSSKNSTNQGQKKGGSQETPGPPASVINNQGSEAISSSRTPFGLDAVVPTNGQKKKE